MIETLANVLIALSCKYTVDPVMFGALADEFEELFIKHVPWHPGVPSIHLNISHGRIIMEHFFPIPFGKRYALEKHDHFG